jgi:hypothetical protein
MNVEQRLAKLEATVAVLTERLASAVKRGEEGLEQIEALEKYLRNRDDELRKERKVDRHWLIGAALSASAIIVTGISLLADKF